MNKLLAATLLAWTSSAFAGGAAARVVAAPTLSELGLIGLAVAVGIAGGLIVRRRK